MSDTLIDRFTVGAGKIIPVDHVGPSSYTTGGETLGSSNNQTGITAMGLATIDAVLGSGTLTESGTYFVMAKQVGTGTQKTFKLVWYAVAGGGGTFTGTPATLTGTVAAPTITTLTNAGTTAPVYTNGGALTQTTGATGITGVQAPALTMNSYTPAGTVTATGFSEVSNGTDLSGEVVRLAYLGR